MWAAWQSSNVPSMAMLCMLLSVTVIICSSCVREVRPSGYMMKHSTPFLPRSPWMAELPVSPDVAPSTVIFCPGRCNKGRMEEWRGRRVEGDLLHRHLLLRMQSGGANGGSRWDRIGYAVVGWDG